MEPESVTPEAVELVDLLAETTPPVLLTDLDPLVVQISVHLADVQKTLQRQADVAAFTVGLFAGKMLFALLEMRKANKQLRALSAQLDVPSS